MPVLSKHAVLTGDTHLYCLLCELIIERHESALQHVQTKTHTDNFAASAYAEEHANERIRKVKRSFFCEVCNSIISSSLKIPPHIATKSHQFNKTHDRGPETSGEFRRVGDKVVVLDMLIDERAWNGIVLKTCVVCDIDWDDIKEHIADVKHLLKLIQMRAIQIKVPGNVGTTLMRQIDSSRFHCLTCNVIVLRDQFGAHWDGNEHETLLIESHKAKQAADEREQLHTKSQTLAIENEPLRSTTHILPTKNGYHMCVLCDWHFTSENIENHLNSTHHEIIQDIYKKEIGQIKEKSQSETSKTEEVKNEDNKSTLDTTPDVETTSDLTEAESDKKTEITMVQITKITPTKDIANDTVSIKEHKVDSADQIGNYANTIYLGESGKTMCRVCNVEIPPKTRNIEEHVNGAKHKNNFDYKHAKIIEKKEIANETASTKKQKVDSPDQMSNDDDNTVCVEESGKLMRKVEMPSTARNIKEDNGAKHNENFAIDVQSVEKVTKEKTKNNKIGEQVHSVVTEKAKYSCMPMKEFIVLWFLNPHGCTINNTICVNINSYCLCVISDKSDKKFHCLCCSHDFHSNNFEIHVNGLAHKQKMADIPVLVSLRDEFVRKVNKSFHCGFCHTVLYGWGGLQNHLKSTGHIMQKTTSNSAINRGSIFAPTEEETLTMVRAIMKSVGRTFFDY